MGSNERREREKQETRAKILDAARELFAAHGFEAVTMRKIAERIEYTPTAIYFHFEDKDALIRELCLTDFQNFAHRFGRAALETDPIERLRIAGEVYAEFALEHPQSYRLMFMTPAKSTLYKTDLPHKGNPAEDAYAFLHATVVQAISEGRLREELTDADLVSQTIWSGMHGFASLDITMREDPWIPWRPLPVRLRAMTDALIYGLARERSPKKTKPSAPAPSAKTKKKKG